MLSGMAKRILIATDDAGYRDPLIRTLRERGFHVTTATDSGSLHRALRETAIGLVILSFNLPDEGGPAALRRLRKDFGVPVIVVVPGTDEADRILSLDTGADDCVADAVSPQEMVSRIGAVLRRITRSEATHWDAGNHLAIFDGWRVNLMSRSLWSAEGQEIELTSSQFDLLSVFLSHANNPLSRDRLLGLLDRGNRDVLNRSIDIQVSRLRHMIEHEPRRPRFIKTVRGVGYMFSGKIHWQGPE